MPELMKGVQWKKRPKKLAWPLAAETKHDEIRCHIIVHPRERRVEFLSYAGNPLANMDYFAAAMMHAAERTGYHEFDAGFQVDGNFGDSYRWVRSTSGLPEEYKECLDNPYRIQFYLFDLPQSPLTYLERKVEMCKVCMVSTFNYVPYEVVENEQQADAFYQKQRKAGFEGAMFKTLHHKYQRKRSGDWVKMKPEEDADGVIVGLVQAVADTDHPELGVVRGGVLPYIGSVVVSCEDGSTATPHGIKRDIGADMLLHPELQDITQTARARIEAYLEEQLLTREKGLQGIIFNLQNNYGWKQKTEMELGEKTRQTVTAQSMSAYDKIAAITAAQQTVSTIPVYEDEDGEQE